jgi:hypothetical protein
MATIGLFCGTVKTLSETASVLCTPSVARTITRPCAEPGHREVSTVIMVVVMPVAIGHHVGSVPLLYNTV